ncbi:MAG: DUF2200 domain-containing protein [Rhizobiaceae bacterium]|nr:DUF2200 domain-containing protein [Rhizobiaceae bacterium]
MASNVFQMSFAKIYPLLVDKVEKKGKTKDQLDAIIAWLTGYDAEGLNAAIDDERDLESFFAQAPRKNPNRNLIKGMVCGVRVEEIEDPIMQEIRYLDKLVDELARGKKFENILRR